MSQPINLNRARKARTKEAAKTQADENAVRFGRSGSAKALDTQRAEKTARDHAAHRLERGIGPGIDDA